MDGRCLQAPAPECNAGEARCEPGRNDVVQFCTQQGLWSTDMCANGAVCIDGACASPATECTSGQKCNGTLLLGCSNGAWEAISDCAKNSMRCAGAEGSAYCEQIPAPAPTPSPTPSPAPSDNTGTILLLAGAAAVVGGAAYFFSMRKK